jgi:hypothetical protein
VTAPPPPVSLAERTVSYVRSYPLLRALLALSLADYAFSAALAVAGRLTWEMAGFLILLNLCAWFFGVAVPILNRSFRELLGASPLSYWGNVVEKFARIVLCALCGLYTAMLVYLALGIM